MRAELDRLEHPVERVLHPQTRRPARCRTGRLTEIFDIDDNAEVPEYATTESWMRLELDAVDEATADELAWPFAESSTTCITRLPTPRRCTSSSSISPTSSTADPGQFDRETSVEAAALLRWLANGSYMILGHAAYSANELASPARPRPPADAKGVLRGVAGISPLELLPASAAARRW